MVSKGLSRLLIPAVIVSMCVLITMPTVALFFGSLWSANPGEPGHLTLDNYVATFSEARSLGLLLNSMVFALGSAFLATAIATIIAFITSRTDTPLARVFTYVPFFTLVIPTLVDALAWVYLLTPRTGLINLFFTQYLGFHDPPFNIYSLGGMIWVMGLSLVPLAFVGVRSAMVSLDPSLEEAARVSGRGIRTVIFSVTLPLVGPAMLSLFLLSFIVAFGSFEIPAVVGIPANIDVYMSVITISALYDNPPNYGLATAQSVIMFVITILFVYLYRRATRRAERFAVITGRGYSPRIMKLGKWRYLGLAILFLYLFVGLILPYFTLFMASLQTYWHPLTLFDSLSLTNYLELTSYSQLPSSTVNGIIVSSLSAFIAVLAAVFIVYYSQKSHVKGRGIIEGFAMLPIAFPGLVLGVGLLWAFISLPLGIYGTIWAFVLAYVIKYVAHGVRFTSEPLLQIHHDLEDASRVSGASTLYTIRRITLVLLRPALLGGWVYIAMITFREIGAAILLLTPGNEVISATLFRVWSSGHVEQAIAAIVLLTFALWGVIIIVSLVSRRRFMFKATP
ncbi:MAG: iron ABC transporter permease [Thaumarchaeota archaeon]|nr:iron ABC transporter permease [Nitrososphaerota archaeon]